MPFHRRPASKGQSKDGVLFIPKEAHRLRSFYRDLAAGSTFHPDDITEEISADWGSLSSSEKDEVVTLTREAAKTIQSLRSDGFFDRARQKADETTMAVATVLGDRLQSKERRKLPSGHRELAALIRRR